MNAQSAKRAERRTRTAVVLAAGQGQRLRPLTEGLPKALVPVGGVPLLLRAVEALTAYGVEHLVVVTGYCAERLHEALAVAPLRVSFCHSRDFATTQNIVSLALCRAAVGPHAFFKLDADVIFDAGVLERLDRSSAALAVAIDGSRRPDEEAMKVAGAGGRIERFGKGVPLDEATGETIGIERIAASAVEVVFDALEQAIEAGHRDWYYEDAYSEAVRRGQVAAEAVDIAGLRWAEIDCLEDLAAAEALFAPRVEATAAQRPSGR